jgi:Domain of unknown function (DUF4336)
MAQQPLTPELLAPGQAGPVREFEPGRIWLSQYPIRYFGIECNARTTLLRSEAGGLIVHSPGPLTDALRAQVAGLGAVETILAPSAFHRLYAARWCRAFPGAGLYIAPGVERRAPALAHGLRIAEGAAYPWSAELEHAVAHIVWIAHEVAFFHCATRTLIVSDLIEYFTDATPCNLATRIWLKGLLFMWNRPALAPEYRYGWLRRGQARAVLERILS